MEFLSPLGVNSHHMKLNPIQIARYALGLSWLYQGFFPKLWTIAPLERQLTATMGFSIPLSDLITRGAGVGEMTFGMLLIVFYKVKTIHLLNIMALVGLLLYVLFMMPTLLIEAFNPVTTNLTMIALSLVLISHIDSSKPS